MPSGPHLGVLAPLEEFANSIQFYLHSIVYRLKL